MRICFASEMADIDREAETRYGLPTRVLMENAGAAVARHAASLGGRRAIVLCGRGNNGGDGLVAARHLAAAGWSVHVLLAQPRAALSGAGADNLPAVESMGLPISEWDGGDFARNLLRQGGIIVDALLGTGLKGPAREPFASIIAAANASGSPIVSVDLPSGVETDTGGVPGQAIKAALTVSFGLPKPAHLVHPAAGLTGRLVVEPIGLPPQLLANQRIQGCVLDAGCAALHLPERKPDAHKGTSGRVALLGGSPGYSGAIRLSAYAALRSGAGLVATGFPDSIAGDMAARPPEIMGFCLPSDDRGCLNPQSLENGLLPAWISEARAVVIGPGLGTAPGALKLVPHLLTSYTGPMIIDADALRALADPAAIRAYDPGRIVITPHPGEMARLTGLTTDDVQRDRISVACRVAREWGTVTVLKGAGTIVARPDGRYFVNTTGNPGMAAGGSGDVLAGAIAGLIAQGASPAGAALCGVYVHGLAADLLAGERPRGYFAGEIADQLPAAIRRVAEHHED